MILNLLIIVAVLAMAIFWSTQGLFSAFIHLVVTVAAGAIAFAVWEPVTLRFLIDAVPKWSWTAGLLLPFAAVLIGLRIASNKWIGGNLKLPGLVDQALGGLVGAVSGFLTAGVCVIAVSFLPLGPALLGYQPIEVQTTGRLGTPTNDTVTSSLWLPADRAAASFFSFASTRGFASARPLGLLRPDLATQAGMFRVGQLYDPGSSLVANPSTVTVEAMHTTDDALPVEVPALIERFVRERAPTRDGDRLVLVTTRWEAKKDTATHDDGILRLPPAQTLLLGAPSNGGPWVLHLPVGWSKTPVGATRAQFYGVVDNRSYASSELPDERITFVYAIPASETPVFFQTRMLRIPLPEPDPALRGAAGGAAVATLLGEPAIDADDEAASANASGSTARTPRRPGSNLVGEPVGNASFRALAIEATAELPGKISINAASGLNVDETEVISGEQRVPRGDRTARVDSIRTPPGQVMVRLELAPMSTSQALPERIVENISGGDGRFRLVGANGSEFFARGTVWMEQSGDQNIRVTDRIDNANELPINRLQEGDRLFAYFALPVNLQLERFVAGAMEQSLDFRVRAVEE